jgi:predicted HTH transcriptional regulator
MSDVCARRHRGSAESRAANERVQSFKLEDQSRIWLYLLANGPATSKEISSALHMGYTTVSARMSELKAEDWLRPTGERRDGAAVLRAVKKSEHVKPMQLQLLQVQE